MIRRLRRLIIRLWLFISWKCCNVTWLWQVESWHYQWQVTQWEQQCHIEWPDQDTGHGDTGTGYKEIVNMIAYLSSSKVIVGLNHHFFYLRYVVSNTLKRDSRQVTRDLWDVWPPQCDTGARAEWRAPVGVSLTQAETVGTVWWWTGVTLQQDQSEVLPDLSFDVYGKLIVRDPGAGVSVVEVINIWNIWYLSFLRN